MSTGPEWLAAKYGIESAELARRIFRDLNEAAKTVDAARALASLLIRAVEQGPAPHPHLITNGFRITFGAVAMALRRFEDDWSWYICHLLPDKKQRPAEAASLRKEIKDRKLYDAANLLVAHSGPKNQAPQSTAERLQMIIDAGWQTEEELIAWYPSVALRLLAVRDAIGAAWPGAEEGAKAL
jgi:hypothetical protein